jgi:acetyl-CoA carboxylase biotin carboxyl carrier protein
MSPTSSWSRREPDYTSCEESGAVQHTVEHAITAAPYPGLPAAPRKDEIPDHFVKVISPIVGTFYRRPSPDAEAFVKEGEWVKKDQTLCIVEAMKLMNEIPAPVDGRIEKVLLTDSQVVEFGEVLFWINPQG